MTRINENPSSIYNCRLSACVRELPAGQCVSIMEQLANSLQEDLLTRLLPTHHTSHRRKKRRRRMEEKRRGAPSATNQPLVSPEAATVSALLKAVELFSLVLLHLPLSVWETEGLHRDAAVEGLLAVHRRVCLPLMATSKTVVREGVEEGGRGRREERGKRVEKHVKNFELQTFLSFVSFPPLLTSRLLSGWV